MTKDEITEKLVWAAVVCHVQRKKPKRWSMSNKPLKWTEDFLPFNHSYLCKDPPFFFFLLHLYVTVWTNAMYDPKPVQSRDLNLVCF